MSLHRRVLITLAGILALLVILFVTSTVLTRELEDDSARREQNARATEAALRFRYHVAQVQQFLTDVSATGETGGYAEAQANRQSADEMLMKLKTLLPDEATRLGEIGPLLQSFHETGQRMAKAYLEGGQTAGNAVMKLPNEGFDDRAAALVDAFDPLLARLEAEDLRLGAEVHDTQQLNARILLGLELIIMLVIGAALWMLRTSLLRTLGGEPAEAVRIARAVSQGQLQQMVETPHPQSMLGAIGDMQGQLREFARRTHEAIQGLDRVANTLSDGAESLSGSAHNASTTTSGMAATMEELANSLHTISDHADEARQASESSSEIADQGARVIRETVAEMGQIERVTHATATQLASLGEASHKITGIVQVIKEVADQTNLLALNAAIEAARAGESGRGFAVVADEVRKLAERTAASTHEIQTLVEGVNAAADSAINAMGDVERRVGSGVELAGSAGSAIDNITGCTQTLMEVIAGISASLREQESAHTELVQQMCVLADLSERNSSLAHETSTTAQEVSRLSASLDETVSWFRL